MGFEETRMFSVDELTEMNVESVIKQVFEALEEKGYNPVNQIVGYLISGDPAYISSHKDARKIIQRVERDEIIEELVRKYIKSI
jgi:uncharacterized protein (UPF0297 family)